MIILPQWHMLVDINPPPLGRVFVHGELEFEDGRDYEFTANLVRNISLISECSITNE